MEEKKTDDECRATDLSTVTETLITDARKIVENTDEVQEKAESDAQRALDETGFGMFNYKVVVVAGLICMNVAFSLSSVGFILPSAACDFDMNTIDKGRLSTAPIFGMLVGSFIWGCIADTRGRRTALLNCLFLQATFECVAAVVPNYWGFLVLKFSSGIAQSGQLNILYTYVGEFQPTNHREKALSFMEIPWVVGIILAPVLAWVIIPIDMELSYSAISFKSWNLFVIMSALPSFFIGCALLALPETPKYLASVGRHSDLRNVLVSMYRRNTGNPTEEYIAKLDEQGIMYFADRINGYANEAIEKNDPGNQSSTMETFRNFFHILNGQTKMLMKPPFAGRTTIICVGTYCILASLYTLLLWFPELFQRFADFEMKHPDESASVCIVSRFVDESTGSNRTIGNSTFSNEETNISDPELMEDCVSTIENQVFIYTAMIGMACIPVAIIFPLCVSRLGFRFYLVTNTFTCCAVTIGLIFVTSSTQNLILSCIYEALISICVTVIYCIVVELFPTNLRVTASALASIFGRLGALIGNATFGYLIDTHCILLISVVASQLFLAGVLAMFLPNDAQIKSTHREKSDAPTKENRSDTDKYSATQL